ncbi:hypothetical protein QFC20_007645 [Naganishia adeliensis]|uniref:Uncharacterized protein n=1 Tax=Naganishia adeliensis TaxID=92952 RepID=A0ACC2UYH4_9TREE|nr:hypothetical protein QFC20_007645 [Naganishia adeliensis]
MQTAAGSRRSDAQNAKTRTETLASSGPSGGAVSRPAYGTLGRGEGTYTSEPTSAPGPRFPLKILRLIAAHLASSNSLATLSSLVALSRRHRDDLLPMLYRCVVWDTVEAWQRMFPHVRKKFPVKKRSEIWAHTRSLIVASEIWDIIQNKTTTLFPNLDLVIIKHATYARTYDPSHRKHLTASESLAMPDDGRALMPLEFQCDIALFGSVSDLTMSELLSMPLKWTYGRRTLMRSVRTVRKSHVKPQGVIRPECLDPQWTPSVPHENLECTIDALKPSAELLDTMRYFCRFLQPSTEWAEGGMKFGADGTFSLVLPGGIKIYRLFTQLLEEILSRNLVINITINLCMPTLPIPTSEFEETMLHTASIYARAWPHIMYAQSLRQPRYQSDAWSIFSIQYIEPAVDSRGLRCEYASFAKITTRPGSPMFRLGISHARRMRYRFVREYGPFEAVEG